MADTARSQGETPPPQQGCIVLSDGSSPLDRLVTVGMPSSLPELQHLAAQHFGHSGCLRLHRNGVHLLYHPTQMKHISDGDVIVVRRSELHPSTGDKDRSVHQSDYVWHTPKVSARAMGNDWESTLSDTNRGHCLEGKSRYAEDYIKHPVSCEPPFKPPSALSLHDDKTGRTSYAEHFPWRENKTPRKPIGSDYVTSLSAKGAQFNGLTSYTIDYQNKPLDQTTRAVCDDSMSTLTEDAMRAPFDGCSTYIDDYKKFGAGRQRLMKPRGQELRKDPFMGSSEYRRQYLEPGRSAKKEILHMAREKLDSQGSVTGNSLREHAAEVARQTGLLSSGGETAVGSKS